MQDKGKQAERFSSTCAFMKDDLFVGMGAFMQEETHNP